MEIAEFLLARIAEDEAVANHARWAMQGEWFTTAEDKVDDFVRRNSPTRVLGKCAADRRIVTKARGWLDEGPDESLTVIAARTHWEDALRLLALPYADHPDYREEWKP